MSNILIKTPEGIAAFENRSPDFNVKQRGAFILCDGQRTLEEVMQMKHLDLDEVQDMIDKGLVSVQSIRAAPTFERFPNSHFSASTPPPVSVQPSALIQPPPPPSSRFPIQSEQDMFAKAYPIASKLTGGLGLRGFTLHLRIEKAICYADLVALVPDIEKKVGAAVAPLKEALGLPPVR